MKEAAPRGTEVTTSPYFSAANTPTRKHYMNGHLHLSSLSSSSSKSPTNPSVCSPYFLRSPSSVYGSVQSLGPLIYTWTSQRVGKSRKRGRDSCRPSTSCRSKSICTSCQPVIVDALRHFECCPIFREKKSNAKLSYGRPVGCEAVVSEADHAATSCTERVGRLAENDWVRHLCPNQCFLRAFAPSRDWIALRRALHCQTNTSVKSVLRDWTCRLANVPQDTVAVKAEDTTERGGIQERPTGKGTKCYRRKRGLSLSVQPQMDNIRKRRPLPIASRTEFISWMNGDEKSCSSLPQLLRQLGCDANDTLDGDVGVPQYSLLSVKRLYFEETHQDVAARDLPLSENDQNPTSWATGFRSANVASPLGLLEELFTDDPWRLLLSTIFLNRTQRKQVDAILYDFLQLWPTPESLIFESNGHIVGCTDHSISANTNSKNNNEQKLESSIANLVSPMGMTNRRARGILQFCRDYLSLMATKKCINQEAAVMEAVEFSLTRKDICSLFYCGDYAADAYQLFIKQDFQSPVLSMDHALLAYSHWKQVTTSKR